MHVIATAGHVDHGKSTLVRALTGMDPDRFSEEKARGLTIDLGFAWTSLPSGRQFAFVDVPGHVRFIENMLAGVGAVDACIFVVAATEGWKPQSEEHLRILQLLGIDHGLVVLTKAALVDEDRLEMVRVEVGERLEGTFLEAVPILEVDAPAGLGLAELLAGLDALACSTPRPTDHGRPRLWVDRCFTVRGAGTVVTGTLAGGHLHVHDVLDSVPGSQPGGSRSPVRVRSLQTHQEPRSEVGPGYRVAVNLGGVPRTELSRGQALVRADQWAPTRTVDATLHVLAALDHHVGRRGAYRIYVGSAQHSVALRILGSVALAPGEDGLVRLHLPTEMALIPGDRYVLRESGRSETVGGGEVLEISPVRKASRARPDKSVDRVVAERGWILSDDLERLTGERRQPNLAARWVVDQHVLDQDRNRLRRAVEEAGPFGLDVAGLSERDRAVLSTLEEITTDGTRARFGNATSNDLGDHPYLAVLAKSPFAPPDPEACEVTRELLAEFVRHGQVIERDGLYFAASAMSEAANAVARLLARHPEGVSTSQVRQELGTSRKYALPILGHLDATGVTRRRGDLRIPGPRLPNA